MKRLAAICVIMLAAVVFSGCEAGNVQRRIVVHAIGIDPYGDGYEVSYQVFSGGEGGSDGPVDASESTVITLLTQGRTLFETEESLRLQTGKEVFLGDVELIVISEELKDADLIEFLRYFSKSDVYLGVNVVYCRGSAQETIGTKLDQGRATSILLRGVVEEAIEQGRACSARIIEIYNAIEEDGATISVPILSVEKSGETGEDVTVSDTMIGVFNCLLVSPEGALREIDEDVSMGICLLKCDIKEMSLEVDIDGKIASLSIKNIDVKRKLRIKGGYPLISVSITGIYDLEYEPLGVSEQEIVEAAQGQILALCGHAYDVFQETGADFLKIEKMLLKYEPKYAEAHSSDLKNVVLGSKYEVSARLRKY